MNKYLLIMWIMCLIIHIVGACTGAAAPSWLNVIALNVIIVLDKIEMLALEAKNRNVQ